VCESVCVCLCVRCMVDGLSCKLSILSFRAVHARHRDLHSSMPINIQRET